MAAAPRSGLGRWPPPIPAPFAGMPGATAGPAAPRTGPGTCGPAVTMAGSGGGLNPAEAVTRPRSSARRPPGLRPRRRRSVGPRCGRRSFPVPRRQDGRSDTGVRPAPALAKVVRRVPPDPTGRTARGACTPRSVQGRTGSPASPRKCRTRSCSWPRMKPRSCRGPNGGGRRIYREPKSPGAAAKAQPCPGSRPFGSGRIGTVAGWRRSARAGRCRARRRAAHRPPGARLRGGAGCAGAPIPGQTSNRTPWASGSAVE